MDDEDQKQSARLRLMVSWMLFSGSILVGIIASMWIALSGFWATGLSNALTLLMGGAQAFSIMSFVLLMVAGGHYFGGNYPRARFFSGGSIFASVIFCILEVVASFQSF